MEQPLQNQKLSVACVEILGSPTNFFSAKSAISDPNTGNSFFSFSINLSGLCFILIILGFWFQFLHLRYCSNLYPKSDCYRICNWCLSQKEESKAKSPNSSNSSSSNKPPITPPDYSSIKKIRINNNNNIATHNHQFRTFQSQENRPIKKQRSPEVSDCPPPPPPRRKPLPVEDNLRRTRSEEISQRGGIQRPLIFRNKVRRYKLLDEVSSWIYYYYYYYSFFTNQTQIIIMIWFLLIDFGFFFF